jgi:hypothetical protein
MKTIKKPKQTVIEVTKCKQCCYRGIGFVCGKYNKVVWLDDIIKSKPGYCKVKRIIVEEIK